MLEKHRPTLLTPNRVVKLFSHGIHSDGAGHRHLSEESPRENIRCVEQALLGGRARLIQPENADA